MTGQEWPKFLAELNASFRGDRVFADQDDPAASARELVWRSDIAGADFDDARAALKLLRARRTDGWMPAVGEMLAALRDVETGPIPSWLEVWPTIERWLKRRNEETRAAMRALPEPTREFVLFYTRDRLAREEVNDPDHGPIVHRRLEQAYDRFVEDYLDGVRVHAALEPGSGPRRLDPARIGLERGA